MNLRPTVKEAHSLKYFTGNHPQLQAHFRTGNRPKEFGNKVWATSLVLLDYLHSRPFKLEGLRVLEVGCGWGLLGVYLAKEFDCQVTCTDFDQHVLPIVDMHAELNGVSVRTARAAFGELTPEYLADFDLIIGAEICYSEEVAQEIILMMERASKAGVGQILIADPGRPDFDDCYEFCAKSYPSELIKLPGSVNGKATHLLSAKT